MWRSIESAPKDGTFIDVWVRDLDGPGGTRFTRVRFEEELFSFLGKNVNGVWKQAGLRGTWVDSDRVTHWMPIPDDPPLDRERE